MFDYACITAIQDYLKSRFPGAFVRGYTGAITRYGDAHIFEIGEVEDAATLTVAHRFLSDHGQALERHLDEHDVPGRLRRDGWVVVRGNGAIEAFDRRRVQSYAMTNGPLGRPATRPS